MSQKDPGTTGKKMSKSSDEGWELYTKELGKVIDAQLNWIRALQAGDPTAPDLLIRWTKKSNWFKEEFGC